MARTPRTPSYCLHRATGRGYAKFRISGTPDYEFHYFPGPWQSPESLAAYADALRAWKETGRPPAKSAPGPPAATPTVADLILAFWDRVRDDGLFLKAGRKTSEHHALRAAFRPLAGHFADHPLDQFGVAQLNRLRREMIALGWAEGTVRRHMQRVRSLFFWGQEAGLVPASVKLASGRGLGKRQQPKGRSTPKKRPPDLYAVGAAAVYAGPPLCSMIWLQVLNGIRPGGVCAMRACDVDRSGELWVYVEPEDAAAKTGRERHVLGPRAQSVLRPYLERAEDPAAPLFRAPHARTRAGYAVSQYRRRVERVCERLGLPHWSPHGLRRLHGTLVRKLYGIEAARLRLGHQQINVTELYAAADHEALKKIAREIG